MVFDYERAWGELLGLLESDPRPNWGARQLRDEMGRILARHRVNEAGIAQMLRLYNVQVDTGLRSQGDAAPTPPAIGDAGAKVVADPHHPMTQGGHDGSSRDSRGDGAADRAGEARAAA